MPRMNRGAWTVRLNCDRVNGEERERRAKGSPSKSMRIWHVDSLSQRPTALWSLDYFRMNDLRIGSEIQRRNEPAEIRRVTVRGVLAFARSRCPRRLERSTCEGSIEVQHSKTDTYVR